MFGLGAIEIIIVLVILLLLFGGSKIPKLMRGLFARIENPQRNLDKLMRRLENRRKRQMNEVRQQPQEATTETSESQIIPRREVMRLSERDDKEAIGLLIVALGSGDEWVRWRAARAFADKAERNPQIILRAALPILQQRVQRRAETEWVRAACLTAIRKIEEATRDMADKPIPALPTDAPTDTLPIPAAPSTPPDSQLPRPSQPPDNDKNGVVE